ncbi:larval cuticle protein A3A-like [Panulirus ornatus]|uniref:larval cuticle protein A3A-like n=1 Tax=Panulirus ornatus TaxID=150431 RepID=UPI003A83F788
MKTVALVLSMVATVAWAAPQGGLGYQPPVQPQYVTVQPQYPDAPAYYSFHWNVNDDYSGNYYGHQEERDGDNTKGSYYVQLPDGRRQKVDYYVDAYGYHPVITYEGEAVYPSPPSQGYIHPSPAPQPVYVHTTPVPFLPSSTPSQIYALTGK